MLNNYDVITFVATVDSERSREFYEDILGLRIYKLVCRAGGAEVNIEVGKAFAATSPDEVGMAILPGSGHLVCLKKQRNPVHVPSRSIRSVEFFTAE